ncbi:MAG: PmoA family protein [Cyclobacteriaceae bacterium]
MIDIVTITKPIAKVALIGSLIFILSCNNGSDAYHHHLAAVDFLRPPSPQLLIIPDSVLPDGNLYLEDIEYEQLYALQKVEGNQYIFIPDTIEANQPKTYKLVTREKFAGSLVSSVVSDGKLNVSVNNKPVLSYQMETVLPDDGSPEYYQRGGFIHPAFAPGGEVLTDGFPVGHTHQHGIFFAWVKTSFQGREIDFWNQHKENGTVVFDSLISYSGGPVFGTFEGAQTAIVLDGDDTTQVLSERWKVKVYNTSQYYIWDIEVSQRNITDDMLQVLPYHYGGMAFRGSADWNDTTATAGQELTGKGQGGFLTSEGLGRSGNHTRPNWVSMLGHVNDQPVNLTVMGHPQNFRTPSYVRIHPTMPYFCFTPVVEHGFDFKPGDIHIARYRLVTFSGKPDPKVIDQLWKQFSQSNMPRKKVAL